MVAGSGNWPATWSSTPWPAAPGSIFGPMSARVHTTSTISSSCACSQWEYFPTPGSKNHTGYIWMEVVTENLIFPSGRSGLSYFWRGALRSSARTRGEMSACENHFCVNSTEIPPAPHQPVFLCFFLDTFLSTSFVIVNISAMAIYAHNQSVAVMPVVLQTNQPCKQG